LSATLLFVHNINILVRSNPNAVSCSEGNNKPKMPYAALKETTQPWPASPLWKKVKC
jgi:hypothetical protein